MCDEGRAALGSFFHLGVRQDLLDSKLEKSPPPQVGFHQPVPFILPACTSHSPTHRALLPIKKVGVSRHGILSLMQTRAFTDVCGEVFGTLYRICAANVNSRSYWHINVTGQ